MSDHRVICGDCLDPATGLASLPDKSVDHVICDPPYEAEAHTLQRRLKREGGARVEECPLDFGAMTEVGRVAVALEMVRVARGWVLVFCQAEAVQMWRETLEYGGATYRRACIWVKPDAQPQLTGDRPGMGYESMVTAWCGDSRSRWNGGGKVWIYTHNKTPGWQKDATNGTRNEHPTQKPLDLMESLVSDFTDPGELICDPFAGSGTTGVACKRLGRRFVGWEREPKYHAIAERRIRDAREQFRLDLPREKPKQETMFPPLPHPREDSSPAPSDEAVRGPASSLGEGKP